MRTTRVTVIALFVVATLCPALPAVAQGTVADYQRAMGMREKYLELGAERPRGRDMDRKVGALLVSPVGQRRK